MSLTKNPRAIALAMIVLGAAAVGLLCTLAPEPGSRSGNKAIMILGIGGIAFGVGLVQLLWPPPPPTDERDERNFISRASWPQKILYVFGGIVGVVAAAVALTVTSGKY